ncbi:MAG: bacteriohemerythrin, partial [Deltaproteobacteria bacterium]|nr:bacteriohemerythrin [Deltaproteobacteria bacterium]
MAIEWSSRLETGVAWQDRQHKEIFRRINGLLDAMNDGFGKEEVSRLFTYLDEYIVVHFAEEEQAMNRYGYPGLISHLAEHMAFIETVCALKQECSAGITTGSVIKVKRAVVDWLANHIAGADHALGRFMMEAGKKGMKSENNPGQP